MLDWVTAPELLRWDQSSWWNNTAWGKLSALFYYSTFEDDSSVADRNIIFNLAGIEGASCSDLDVMSNLAIG